MFSLSFYFLVCLPILYSPHPFFLSILLLSLSLSLYLSFYSLQNVMQKVVGRQGSTKGGRSSSPDRKQRQRQMLQEIRQNISEVRFETGEAIGAMGTDMNRMGKRLSRSSTTEADDEPNLPGDYGATDTLRMMKQLIIDQRG